MFWALSYPPRPLSQRPTTVLNPSGSAPETLMFLLTTLQFSNYNFKDFILQFVHTYNAYLQGV